MIYNDLIAHKTKLAVVGLGYVGMPIAVAFSKKDVNVIGFDVNSEKIKNYRNGIDLTNEVGNEELKKTRVEFSADEKLLKETSFYIVAVPTPVNLDKTPDLAPVVSASEVVGRNLKKGSIVVFESTVYPGVTEEICVPVLEQQSGLKCGQDFFIGYSPERINPGDKQHRLCNIKKIVSGMNDEILDTIAKVYEIIIEAGVHRAPSIKVAEAAKVVENSQRDINIAFMNELALAFDKMNIDTQDVIDAMNTKWNALGFKPGLVGGHCIGVDPYYFIYQAEKLGYHSQLILSGRKVNDSMGEFIAEKAVKLLFKADKKMSESKVAILGITFKENCPDVRNSKVFDIVDNLKSYNVNPILIDPVADKEDAKRLYGCNLENIESIKNLDCIILAVAHDEFIKMGEEKLCEIFGKYDNRKKIIIDVKSVLDSNKLSEQGYIYWRL
ncbi:nucleotide sugar dehydrogenase [Anaerocolumna jejuensis]|uniref:nucleotide sugar dehydrogenase n=1 Tax=Anaerocolumna jejuensis TaxID=259063 RepID=UPI003F7CBDA5